MMSISRVLSTSKRFDSSSQSSSSSLLTSTPVTGRPILTHEPAQSPIEQKNGSQTIVTPARANPARVRGRLGLSSLSINESSNSRYRTRSQSRILESSSFLDQLNTPKRNLNVKELSVKIHKLVVPLKPEAAPNAKKTGAKFSIFKPNFTSPLTRSRSDISIGERGRQRTRTADEGSGSTRNTIKSIIGNKENGSKPKALAKFNIPILQKKLTPEKICNKIKVLQKQSLENQIPIKTQNKILAKPIKNKYVANKKNIPADLPAPSKEPAPPQSKEPAPPQSKEPAPPQSKEPAPPQSKEPAPPQSKEPAPPQSKEPAPPQSKEPAPPQSKEPAPPQSKEPAPPQSKDTRRKDTGKDIITSQKPTKPINGRKTTKISDISKKPAEVKSKEKSSTLNNNIASNKSIPEACHPAVAIAVGDDAYSNNNASRDSCHSISARISGDSSKPSFVRRKLYSRTSDYDDNESTKHVDQSFLEKKDKQNLYYLNSKESTRKTSTSGEEVEQSEDPGKAAENLRQYCLRKKVDKNFTKFFCDSEKIIDCAIKDANDAKESTCKLVSNILKDMKRQNIPKEQSPCNADKHTNSKDQASDDGSNKQNEKINPEFDESSFDIFTQKEKDMSKSPTRKKAKSKVSKASKAKPPKKKITKPPVKKVLKIPVRRSREKLKNTESVRENNNTKIVKKCTEALEEPKTARTKPRSKNKSIIVEKTYAYVLRKSDQSLNYPELDAAVSNIRSKDAMKRTRVAHTSNTQISSTQRRIQSTQQQPHNKRKDWEDMHYRRKGTDYNQRPPLGTIDNDSTIVFRNGKLIPGNFGDKTYLSSQNFFDHTDNIGSRAGPNIKLNYKTKFNDFHGRFDDFDAFERYAHRPREAPFFDRTAMNIARETPFFDRTAMNIAREKGQHMAHSQYVFKNPSNVLWNPKPSLDYTVCVENRYGEDATSSSNFRNHSNQVRNPFDRSTKYAVEKISSSQYGSAAPNQLSLCFPGRGGTSKKGQDILDKTKALNKIITLPACTQVRNVKTSQRTYGRDSQYNERIRNSYMHYDEDIPRERCRNPFPSTRPTTQVSNYYTSQNPAVIIKQHALHYNESDGFKMPMDRSRKRKIINEEFNQTENEFKRSRVDDSRFSTISNIGSSTQMFNFYSRKEKSSYGKPAAPSVIKSSTVLNPVKKISERAMAIDDGRHVLRNNLHVGSSDEDDSRSNYFSDSEHDDTVISTNNYTSIQYKPKESVPNVEMHPTTSKQVISKNNYTSIKYKPKESCSNFEMRQHPTTASREVISTNYYTSIKGKPEENVTNVEMRQHPTTASREVISTNYYTSIDKPEENVTNVEMRQHPTTASKEVISTNYYTSIDKPEENVTNVEMRQHPTTASREGISTNYYTSIKDKPKESVTNVEMRPHPTTAKESTTIEAANNKKYDICEDDISNIIIKKNNNYGDGDDDTFFFKGSYTSETADLNSIYSSKPHSSTTRMETSKIGADFTIKYSLAAAVASTSSAQQNTSSAPIQKSKLDLFDGEFKRPAVVDNRATSVESPTPNNGDTVSRLANCSPWRFSKAKNDDKISRVSNCSPWRYSKW